MALRLVQHKKNKPAQSTSEDKDKILQMLGANNPELVDVISSRLMSMYGNNNGEGKKGKAESDSSSKDPAKTENSDKGTKEEGQVWNG